MLEVRDLSLGFATPQGLLGAVSGLSLQVAPGETLALLGESGSGKSVTAQALLRLLPPAGRVLGGQVLLEGEDLLRLPEARMRDVRGRRVAMIFQEPATSLNPVLTVGQQIGEVLARHLGLQGAAARERMCSLLRQVGIADPERRLDEYPFQFSGGMKQRVMIAIALACEPDYLIADEPTTALDVTVQAQILDLLRALQQARGMGILLITHDLGVVARMADRVGVMYAGQMVEVAPRAAFFSQPAHPYARALFAALPEHAGRGQSLQALPGQVPALAALPTGCRFAPRCAWAEDACRVQPPEWVPVGAGDQQVRCWRHPLAGGGGEAVALGFQAGSVATAPALLQVQDLAVHFPIRRGVLQRTVGHVKAVDGVSLSLAPGRTLALVGESGCGKTTVGKAILQLIRPTSGSVRVAGCALEQLPPRRLRSLRRQMQMVFQDPFASLNPRLRVGEIIAEGMQALGVTPEADMQAAIAALLQQVGLDPASAERYPHEFSGGQRQRIAIARALAVQPGLLVCDEPTSALDVSVQAQILNLLKGLQSDLGVAYLLITHNFAVVDYLAHSVAVMYLGRIVEYGPVEAVLRTPRHPYTQALLAAVPRPVLEQPERVPLGGETPSPANPPVGCHFHPRCPQATAVCQDRYPTVQPLANDHQVACHLVLPAS